MSELIGGLIGTIVGSAIGSLLGALLLQHVTKAIAQYKPTYGAAYLASFVCSSVAFSADFVFARMVIAGACRPGFAGYSVLTIFLFALYSWLLGIILKHPGSGPIGFKSAALISLTCVAVIMAVGIIGGVFSALTIGR